MKVPPTYRAPAGEQIAGTIGVVSSELARYSDFCLALNVMWKPENARIIWLGTSHVAGNCNEICRRVEGDWLWIMGDDHVFEPDILHRLLSHNVDVVVPLCFTRTPPYFPVVFEGRNDEGHHRVDHHLPEHGLVEVFAAGSAGMLIRRHVIDAIPDPWFEWERTQGEDMNFCQKVREAGFRIYCDVDTPLGHIAPHTIWPQYRGGYWEPNVVLSQDVVVPLRAIRDEEPEAVPA